MPKYLHMYNLPFEVISNNEKAEGMTAEQLRYAILRQLHVLLDSELVDVCDKPFASYHMDSDQLTPVDSGE